MITTAVPKVACPQSGKNFTLHNTYETKAGERILKAYYRTPIAIHFNLNGM
jgi:hypothetical protein